jgi:hypothetical protein
VDVEDLFASAVRQWSDLVNRHGHVDAEVTLTSAEGPQFAAHGWMDANHFYTPTGLSPLALTFSGTLGSPSLRHPLWFDGTRRIAITYWLAEHKAHKPLDMDTRVDPPEGTNEQSMTFVNGYATSDHSYASSLPAPDRYISVVFTDPLHRLVGGPLSLHGEFTVRVSDFAHPADER